MVFLPKSISNFPFFVTKKVILLHGDFGKLSFIIIKCAFPVALKPLPLKSVYSVLLSASKLSSFTRILFRKEADTQSGFVPVSKIASMSC